MPNDITLIGPVRAGKSTIAAILGERLNLPQYAMDEACWDYYRAMGYDDVYGDNLQKNDFAAFDAYVRQYYPTMIESFLRDHTGGIIDFGGGHSVFNDPTDLERVRAALEPYPNVVLIQPSPDTAETLRVLDARTEARWRDAIALMNREFVNHPANFVLAKIVVYTQGKTPQETVDEILTKVVLS